MTAVPGGDTIGKLLVILGYVKRVLALSKLNSVLRFQDMWENKGGKILNVSFMIGLKLWWRIAKQTHPELSYRKW